MTSKFVHLHLHTEYSMLDGKGKVSDYVKRAKQLKMPALSITDHGNLSGSYEFYRECIDNDIEPVLGCEFYFVPNADLVKEEREGERFHVGFLARDEIGFRILVELSNESHRHYYYKPLLDRSMLEAIPRKDRKHLVVLSGCASSIISRKALENPSAARAELQWWNAEFPNFYLELMHHGTAFDKRLNDRLLKLAARYELPWVITNDPHYVMKEECDHHDALLAIQTASDLDDPNRFRFDGSGYHLRSRREIQRVFDANYAKSVWKPGIAETMRIAKSCRTRIPAWDSRSWHIPSFPGVDNADRELRRLTLRGLAARGLEENSDYVKRAKHELKEFKKVGMADFLLITRDANEHARKKKIRVGPGRGSVCGTLVGYLIGIHKIDPIKYDLLFERFLNPERPKMPDIDTDFPSSVRNEMISYAINKYGDENTQRVGAFQTMQIRKTFKNVGRAFGIDYNTLNRLAKQIDEDIDGNVILPPEIEEGYPELHGLLEALTGLKSGLSRHAAGVIILAPDDPVRGLLPIQWIPSSKAFVSQFDLDTAAGIGLLKNDYLALRTLDTIDECVRMVKERHGVEIEPDDWVPDEEKHDKQIYKMLAKGNVEGVFQMEGGTNRRGIKEMECSCFEDIVACTSLYRKGPLDDKADDRYLKNKRDGKIRVAHKSLKQFLGRTWGEMIYQEQMFQMLNELAGFSWARVDDAKTAMVKKDAKKMALLKDEAVAGFRKVSGMDRATAEKAWDKIQACAGYLFNRSHAVAYSMITYQTARLKYLYPLEYMAALLRTVVPDTKEKKEKRIEYMGVAMQMGYKILPPDVNLSDWGFTPVGDDQLLFGLQDIKDVGPAAVKKITAYRDKKRERLAKRGLDTDKTLHTVTEVSVLVNAKVMRALEGSGAMKGFGIEPSEASQEELLSWQFHDPLAGFRKKLEKKVKLPNGKRSNVVIAGELIKAERRQTKTGSSYYTWTLRWKPGETFRINVWDSASSLFKLLPGSVVMVSGDWSEQYNNTAVGDSEDVRIIKKVTKKSKKPSVV